MLLTCQGVVLFLDRDTVQDEYPSTALNKCYISLCQAKSQAVCCSRCASWLAVPSSALHPHCTTTVALVKVSPLGDTDPLLRSKRGLTRAYCCGSPRPFQGLDGRRSRSTPTGLGQTAELPYTAFSVSKISQSPKGIEIAEQTEHGDGRCQKPPLPERE